VIDEAKELAEEAVAAEPSDQTAASAETAPTESAPAETAVPEAASSQVDPAPEAQDTEKPPIDSPLDVLPIDPSASEGEGSTADAVSEGSETPATPQDESAASDEVHSSGLVDEAPLDDEAIVMDWYILKVQSNREKSISEALERRVKIAGLDEHFEQVVVPTEKVTEFKNGKKRVVNRKLYPGYILVRMHINDDTWFVVRETPGIGDFTGSGGKPTPMLPQEVQRIISTEEETPDEAPKLKISFKIGDRVKVNEGTFESFEGEVSTVDEASGHITVMINIFGRSTPVELEYWQAEAL
jgi:transcriptional antiterminator NusG